MSSSADLVILGAGPAGLAAAWRAARRGYSVVVLERANVVGGMAGSFEVDGVRVDHGSHRLHPATPPQLVGELRTLLGADLQLRRRNGRLRLAEQWLGFPLRGAELVKALPVSMMVRIGLDAAAAPLRRGPADSYAAALRQSLGGTLYDALYGPYAVKLWGLPGERIDAEQARRRVTADTPWKIAARILRGRADGPGRLFYYPRRGFGQIVEALADSAAAAGAEIRLGAEVQRIHASPDHGVRVGTGTDELLGNQVFSTLPLPVLARMTHPAPEPAAIEATDRLRFRAMVLVYLTHAGGRWTDYDAHYLPGPERPVTRISEPANYRQSAADPLDRSVACAEIPCEASPTDPIWRADDAELGELVRDTAARLELPPLRLTAVTTKRLARVYPIYEIGFQDSLRGIDAWAAGLPRVTTFGRLGLFAHDNTHHALAMGYDAVDALTNGGFDEPAWAAARERFAAHVVED
ncbi:MAG TPA: FAD-dependent oxidoreductase [Actinomycetes bacterium]|nr:FAD-dependent oxidoreductase [Actinomycetes bacterium]